MNYDTMTIESLADDCFRRSGYKINKADLISRITHLCENHKSEVNVALDDVSQQRELLGKFYVHLSEQAIIHDTCRNDEEMEEAIRKFNL